MPGEILAVTVMAWPVAAGLGLMVKFAEEASATFPEKQPSAITVSAQRKFLTIPPLKILFNKNLLEILHGFRGGSALARSTRASLRAQQLFFKTPTVYACACYVASVS